MVRKILSGTLVAALLAGTASADTLREALVDAYQSNPTLTAQREALRATDATVAIARAAGRPQVSGTVGLNRDLTRSGILNTGGSKNNLSVGVDVSYPLFNGGSVRNQVRGAETRVLAGRATLQAVEGDVFTNAVSAYMDVIRDRSIVELNQNNVKVLETNLKATQDRFQIGDVTRTDVAQSEARLQLGRSQLATAQGQLTASEATYRQVIGHAPGQLAPPPPLPPLPATADEAVRIALTDNPDLVSVVQQATAAGYDVRVAGASRLPTLSVGGSGTYVNYLGNEGKNLFGQANPSSGAQTAIGLNANIPIFQGGLPTARIRQAQALQGQLLEQVVGTERAVVQATRAAFAGYSAAQLAIQANSVAVQADQLALEGSRAEQTVGTRTVLDVLNAEQELLNSQVALVTAKRDAYVAGFQLLNAMGVATAKDLGLDGGPLYDPLGNYRRVAANWSDWANDPAPRPVATRTVDPQELPPAPIVTPQIITNSNLPEPTAAEMNGTQVAPRATVTNPMLAPPTVTQPPVSATITQPATSGVTSPRR
ncbi:TolC family outer membrane protein [Sphingomonas sp.]|uniref:TolC family outer membrane protein n=1 Tax=Sphingomonas sp. TaxID=28214 RepID=UPI0025FC6AFB|nr:TolC family outer membrane protein [Sphingomonas sp.]